MESNAYYNSMMLLKKQIQSGKYSLDTKIKVLTINNKFVGYCGKDECKSGIPTTAGELLSKLESIVGRQRGN